MTKRFCLPTGDGTVAITASTKADLFAAVNTAFDAERGFTLATINLDHVVKLATQKAFQKAYREQTIIVADGNPIVWLSRLAGRGVELIPGSELIEPLSALAAEKRVPVGLIGSTDETLLKTASYLENRYPGLQIVAKLAPSFQFDPDGAEATTLLEKLNVSGARLCFLALGAPKQELLAARGLTTCPHIGFVSIGAGLDFLAGHQMRAPLFLRRIAMEWFWRMMLSPKRLFWRYAQCALILPGLSMKALSQRFRIDNEGTRQV